MKGPPSPTPASPALGTDGAERYEVPELAALARKAWRSLEEHGHDAHGNWRRFKAVVTARKHEECLPEDDALLQRLRSSLARDGTPTFAGSEVLCWVASRLDPWSRPTIWPTAPSLGDLTAFHVASAWGLRTPPRGEPPVSTARIASDLERGGLGRTTIWAHARRWFAAGELGDGLRASLSQHCPSLELREPSFLRALAARLREQRNPWRRRPCWFVELSEHALSECGVRLGAAAWYWLSAVMLRESEGCSRRAVRADPVLVARAREQLSAVLERSGELSEAHAWIIFVLRAALDSDFVLLRANPELTAWSAVAQVGAGRLIRLACTHYGLDDAASMSLTSEPVSRHRYEAHLDGGDVHLRILELDPIELLDGGRPQSLASQRA